MKKKLLMLLVCISIFQLNAQDLLKEISKTFDNGQPMFINYLEMEDLKKVLTEFYNESGTLIFSIQFNKDTGLPDGEFYDLINKGYFKDGALNCNDCMLVEENTPSVFSYNHNRQNTLVTKGDVVNGRLIGKVERYTLHEGTYNKIDWESTREYVRAGAGVGFRDVKTYSTGVFEKNQLPTKFYNSNGRLDGEYKVGRQDGWHAKLNVKNGIVKSYVSYDRHNIIIDSLSNENKIWKINYKFVKNDGEIIFYGYDQIKPADERIRRENFFYATGETAMILSYGGPLVLDSNGMYTISLISTFDNIIHYDLNERTTYNNGFLDFKRKDYSNSRNINFFVLIYNLLVNNRNEILNFRFKYNNNYEGPPSSLLQFIQALSSDHYLRYDNKNALRRGNSFKKYIMEDGQIYTTDIYTEFDMAKPTKEWEDLPWEDPDGNKDLTVKNFFKNIISPTDYLRACKESIENKETSIQEISVWNMVTKSYDKVDFDKLIELSKELNIEEADYSRVEEYTKALELGNDSYSNYGARGIVRVQASREYNKAIADLTKAIDLCEERFNADYNKYKELKITCNPLPLYFYRGIAKKELQDYNGAIADLTKAIELGANSEGENNKNIYLNSYYFAGMVKMEESKNIRRERLSLRKGVSGKHEDYYKEKELISIEKDLMRLSIPYLLSCYELNKSSTLVVIKLRQAYLTVDDTDNYKKFAAIYEELKTKS